MKENNNPKVRNKVSRLAKALTPSKKGLDIMFQELYLGLPFMYVCHPEHLKHMNNGIPADAPFRYIGYIVPAIVTLTYLAERGYRLIKSRRDREDVR